MQSLFEFDIKLYKADLYRAVEDVLNDIKKDIISTMRSNLMSISFKDNPVRLAGGEVTSDAKRRRAVFNAIEGDIVKPTRSSVELHIGALRKNFREAHIGIYYEHGTGEEWDGEYEGSGGSMINGSYRSRSQVNRTGAYLRSVNRNIDRPNRQIVTRSRHRNYNGLGKGIWIDLGGNRRITRAIEGGKRDAGFEKYIGEDIKAHKWFSGAIDKHKPEIKERLERVLTEEVVVFDYMKSNYSKSAKKELVLGKKLV